jgi:acyl carrier protein
LRDLGLSPETLADDLDLHEAGVIDSFGLIELIAEVEERFEIEIDFEHLDPEHLTRVGPLSRFIEQEAGRQVGSVRSSTRR